VRLEQAKSNTVSLTMKWSDWAWGEIHLIRRVDPES
jgi:hypothetical protein